MTIKPNTFYKETFTNFIYFFSTDNKDVYYIMQYNRKTKKSTKYKRIRLSKLKTLYTSIKNINCFANTNVEEITESDVLLQLL